MKISIFGPYYIRVPDKPEFFNHAISVFVKHHGLTQKTALTKIPSITVEITKIHSVDL